MISKYRTGILGGLFDPPHMGHLIAAQFVLEEFNLHRILFVPAGKPPHKHKYSPYDIRFKMTELAIKNNRKFSISNIEKDIPGKTYTVEVIKRIRQQIMGILYLIIGRDQWEEISTWKTPEELFKLCRIIVMPRPDGPVSKGGRFSEKILFSHSPSIAISSTIIRERVKQGKDVKYLVPASVYSYIKRKKLYK
jgi:nicotinate-nucleotide adenylyltransferase